MGLLATHVLYSGNNVIQTSKMLRIIQYTICMTLASLKYVHVGIAKCFQRLSSVA